MPAVSGPLLQAAALPVGPYSPYNTYIAIIASDGDNMQVGDPVRCALARDAPVKASLHMPGSPVAAVSMS